MITPAGQCSKPLLKEHWYKEILSPTSTADSFIVGAASGLPHPAAAFFLQRPGLQKLPVFAECVIQAIEQSSFVEVNEHGTVATSATRIRSGCSAGKEPPRREFHADPDRTYLTGLSMGGYGAWELARLHPHRWAAVAIAAAGVLSPVICAILMPVSSISVVLFACGATNLAAKRAGLTT